MPQRNLYVHIIDKKDAIFIGMTKYFTGKICRHGHISQRYISWQCISCCTARMKEYHSRNPEIAAKAKKKYRRENIDKTNAASVRWQRNNRDKTRLYVSKWSKTNPLVKLSCNQNRRSRILDAEGYFSPEDISTMLSSQEGMCAGCGVGILSGYHIDHIMPLALGGSNWPSNLQLLCASCNCSKGAKHPSEWRPKKLTSTT